MNLWLAASAGVLVAWFPLTFIAIRGEPEERLVGLETAGVVATVVLVTLAEAFHRPAFFDLALTLALLCFGGSMVFVRFLERWL